MNKRVSVSPRWYGSMPHKNGKPLPKNQWVRAGRKRKWIVRWHAPDGTRPQETFETKGEAESAARVKITEFESGGFQARVRPKRQTLGAFVDELLMLRTGPTGRRWSHAALQDYRTVMGRFTAFVGHTVPLDAITVSHGLHFVAHLQSTTTRHKKCPSAWTINRHKRVLSGAFNIAVTQFGYVKVNPFAGKLKLDKIAPTPLRYVTSAEFTKLIETCRTMPRALWWEAFLTVCYTAGLRLNEVVHLTWPDVDFGDDTIRVIAKPEQQGLAAWRPKDYDSRTIPAPPITMALLGRLHGEAAAGSEFVFVSPERSDWIRSKRDGGTWPEGARVLNNTSRDFQCRADKAGVAHATIHDLRRAAITHWARRLAVAVVKELAGHEDIATTMRYYVSIRPSDMADARNVAADALRVDAKWTQKDRKAVP